MKQSAVYILRSKEYGALYIGVTYDFTKGSMSTKVI
jgi:predicted GIY-YIG superfamily endonuclease